MYPIELRFDIFSFFILIGVVQGFFLSYFFLKKSNRSIISNRFNGLLLLSLALVTLDIWLNYTGYMVRVIYIDNFSESFNFLIAPAVYLYIRTSIKPHFSKKDYLHFIPFALFTIAVVFHLIQPDEVKFNSFLECYHPDLPKVEQTVIFSNDPFYIRRYINELLFIHFFVYTVLGWRLIFKQRIQMKEPLFKIENKHFRWLLNVQFFTTLIIFLFLFIKLYFYTDLGDYIIATAVSLLIYLTSFYVINHSNFFSQNRLETDTRKYEKSSLDEAIKDDIAKRLIQEMTVQKYYTNNMASLPHLAKTINSAKHHVSQVINERIGKSFFEWLAFLRIEEAKTILKKKDASKLTIEEIAEEVGYNSKSAFNKAFKKHTGLTPTQFRDN